MNISEMDSPSWDADALERDDEFDDHDEDAEDPDADADADEDEEDDDELDEPDPEEDLPSVLNVTPIICPGVSSSSSA